MQMVDPSWTPIALLKYPLVPDVRAGDTVAIDLLENPTTGQKVVDYLVFKRSNATAAAERSPLRDLSLLEVRAAAGRFSDQRERSGPGRLYACGGRYSRAPRSGSTCRSEAVSCCHCCRTRSSGSAVLAKSRGRSLTFTEGHDRYDIKAQFGSFRPGGGSTFTSFMIPRGDRRVMRFFAAHCRSSRSRRMVGREVTRSNGSLNSSRGKPPSPVPTNKGEGRFSVGTSRRCGGRISCHPVRRNLRARSGVERAAPSPSSVSRADSGR